MKKLLFTLMTCAAIVSCSKSDVIYDEFQQEIGFTAVASNSTKSVAGYDYDPGTADKPNSKYGTFDGVFPTEIDLYVFANASNDAGTAWDSPYFKNALFTHKSGGSINEVDNPGAINNKTATGGAYSGSPYPYYWPNVKSLKFAGYSSAYDFVNAQTKPSMNDAFTKLTLPAYTQDNTKSTEGANDLMWFINTDSYTKQANEVPAQMKHACSWITIQVKGDGNYTTLALNGLTINGLYHTGTATCGTESATWNDLTNVYAEAYYTNADGDDNDIPNTSGATAKVFETIANNMIVIPQTPTTIDITYSFSTQEGITPIQETKTALPLSLGKVKDSEGNDTEILWESGKHYIYTITITATEILIDPYVENWTEHDHDSSAKGNQPIPVPVQ